MNWSPEIEIKKHRQRIWVCQGVSVFIFLFGIWAIILFVGPSSVGVPFEDAESYRGHLIWLITGLMFVVLGILFVFGAQRSFQRSVWVYRNTSPKEMPVILMVRTTSDSTDFSVILKEREGDLPGPGDRKIQIFSPSWKVEKISVKETIGKVSVEKMCGKEMQSKVYADPASGRPGLIETEFGLLWPLSEWPIFRRKGFVLPAVLKIIFALGNFLKGFSLLPAVFVLYMGLLIIIPPVPWGFVLVLAILSALMIFWARKAVRSWKGNKAFGIGSAVGFLMTVALCFPWVGVFVAPYPNQGKIISELKQYKIQHGHYPESLSKAGFKVDETRVSYHPHAEGAEFTLCYIHPGIIVADKECYDTKANEWSPD